MITRLPPAECFDNFQTPALLIRLDLVRRNLERMHKYLGGDWDRWRPHVKTTKIPEVLQIILEFGIRNFKVATTREAAVLLELAERRGNPVDILVAYPLFGANLARVGELAHRYSNHSISLLVDSPEGVDALAQAAFPSRIGVFLDLNSGMNRTGTELRNPKSWRKSLQPILPHHSFLGLHWYDGHVGPGDESERRKTCHQGLDVLCQTWDAFAEEGLSPSEVITSGTPGFVHALSYPRWKEGLLHRVSPGTLVYWDRMSQTQLPELDFEPAASIVSRIVSRPRPDRLTCDAGHKTLSADAGDPVGWIPDHPELSPLHPSEEHLPLQIEGETERKIGDLIAIVPTHVCPSVNNSNHALLWDPQRNPDELSCVPVVARGHEVSRSPQIDYFQSS